MDRPDLHEMDVAARELYDALNVFQGELEEAKFAAEGELPEGATNVLPDTGNGDRVDLFDEATKDVHEAMAAVVRLRRLLATQQGLRDFEREWVS